MAALSHRVTVSELRLDNGTGKRLAQAD